MMLYVDIIDSCHLRCSTCPRGIRALPNTAKKMSLEKFELIVRKAKREGVTIIALFNWTDPFICRNLYEYTSIIKQYGLYSFVSTTLSFKNMYNLEKALQTIDNMEVTISGFSQQTHEINHRGGNIDFVKQNLAKVAAIRADKSKGVNANIVVKYLEFDYNKEEAAQFETYANEIGLSFRVLPAVGNPLSAAATPENLRLDFDRQAIASASAPPDHGTDKICPMLFSHIPLDANGDAYHCCIFGNYEQVKIGNYLELDGSEILYRRFTHSMCNTCSWSRREPTPDEKLALTQALLLGKNEPAKTADLVNVPA